MTYIHHDADRQMTWVTCRSGAKLWFIVHLKTLEEHKQKLINKLFMLYDTLLPDSEDNLCVLIQPLASCHLEHGTQYTLQ